MPTIILIIALYALSVGPGLIIIIILLQKLCDNIISALKRRVVLIVLFKKEIQRLFC